MIFARRTAVLFTLATIPLLSAATPPVLGDKAPDFTLPDLHGQPVRLSQITATAPVVLVVLRGYPGYQCPHCTRQVQHFIAHASGFAKAGVEVLFIYPGPSDTTTDLKAKAAASAAGIVLPPHFRLLVDTGYDFTNLYGLRWDAPQETAWPSTFVPDLHGVICYAKISREHAGRTTAAEILQALDQRAPARIP